MTGNPLDPSAIAAILEADRNRPATTTRKKKDATEPRIYATWWKLPQSVGTCDNPDCSDPRDGGGPNGTAMVSEVKDKNCCRYCFLEGYLSDGN